MHSRRPLAINNSLAHGICNYSCRLCGVNKNTYDGPKMFQPEEITRAVISRCHEAAESGIYIRYIANAGDGEPTLHPQFCERIAMFGEMKKTWSYEEIPCPEISVVTNGSHLADGPQLDAIAEHGISLIVSFPTADSGHYGEMMDVDFGRGEQLLGKVTEGLRKVMSLHGKGAVPILNFHISPPEREIIRSDFDRTVQFLSGLAKENGVRQLTLLLFPATSNRSGLIRNKIKGIDIFKDLYRRYNRKSPYGVPVVIGYSIRRFFKGYSEMFDLFRAHRYPCFWNANLFLTADGTSICCNDQAVHTPLGNIQSHSIAELMQNKESFQPGRACVKCDQAPTRMRGNALSLLWRNAVRLKSMQRK